MWISRKKLKELERRIADLEEKTNIKNISEQLADGIKESMSGCNSNKEITPQNIDYLRKVAEESAISVLASHKTSEQKQ